MKNFQKKLVGDDIKKGLNQAPSVEEYMTRDLITFKKDTDINVVIKSLLDNRISGAPVLDDNGQVVGLIDDKDCLNILFGNVYNRKLFKVSLYGCEMTFSANSSAFFSSVALLCTQKRASI